MKISTKKYASAEYLNQVQQLWDWFNSKEAHLELKTSGTTGRPQSIALKREALLASAQMSIDFFGFNSETRIGLCLPLDKVGGVMLALRAFVAEASLVPISPQRKVLSLLEEPLDFISMVPNQVAAEAQHWHKAKTILIGGGPVHQELEEQLKKAKSITVWHSYASTETLSHVALRAIGRNVYRGLKGIHFSQQSNGCLTIDAERLGLKAIHTKDLVDLIDSSHFIWKGRLDNVVLSGGLKIYPEGLESKVNLELPFFLAGQPDTALGERLVLVVQERDYHEDLLKALLPLKGTERPKAVLLVDEIKYTETGKIRRNPSLEGTKRLIELQG